MKKSILILEDNQEMACVLSEYFKDQGFDSEVANNGKQAISKFHNNKFHMLLTDFKLPDMDGNVVVEKCRQNNPNLKVIFLSAFNLEQKIQVDSDTRILEKPCKPKKIFETVTKMLQTR